MDMVNEREVSHQQLQYDLNLEQDLEVIADTMQPNDASSLDELRAILLEGHEDTLQLLHTDVSELRKHVNEDLLNRKIKALIPQALEEGIRESPQEIVEILYPILGPMIQRMITESIRSLVEKIDAKLRKTFDFNQIVRRYRARARGMSDAEILFRESLPFEVMEVLLIHRETGLLISHAAKNATAIHDSDIVGSMLTAIRDFVHVVFGGNEHGDLDEIKYDDKRILIEMFQHIYIAVVVHGVEPYDYRNQIRQLIIEFERRHVDALKSYAGENAGFPDADEILRQLLA